MEKKLNAKANQKTKTRGALWRHEWIEGKKVYSVSSQVCSSRAAWVLDRGAKWLQLWSFLWGEFANFRGFLTMVEQKCLVEQKRSSKNNWSSKIGRAKIFGRAKMVEQKKLVEQKAVQIVPPICPAGPSDGAAPLSKITTKPL